MHGCNLQRLNSPSAIAYNQCNCDARSQTTDRGERKAVVFASTTKPSALTSPLASLGTNERFYLSWSQGSPARCSRLRLLAKKHRVTVTAENTTWCEHIHQPGRNGPVGAAHHSRKSSVR
ncbi:hypothetical protein V2G26_014132 [Clonostachys chloroleuca]